MAEHMDVPIDTSNMSEQELQFHYFKMHDADGNNKLDGCELVKSLIHWHGKCKKIFLTEFLVQLFTLNDQNLVRSPSHDILEEKCTIFCYEIRQSVL